MIADDDFRTPGQLIEALLTEKQWTKRTLAIVLGVGDSVINKIVADKQPVDAKYALLLEDVFGVKAERFLELQRSFDLAKARFAARPDPGRANRAHLFGGLPIADMIKRGWINASDQRNVAEVEASLANFFGVSSADQIPILPHAAKKTAVAGDPTPSQLAWLYRVREIASETLVSRFSPAALDDAIAKLRNLMGAAEEIRKVPRILAEAGIRFVIVESLPSAKIDGVCFWLHDNAPVIGMSLRHDRIDNFWFVLRHELEHVRQGHGKAAMIFDAELEGDRAGVGPDVSEEERVANGAASAFCVPPDQMDAFIDRKAPFFSERDMIGFARLMGVHTGVIAGQLQHRTGRYDRFREHLVKIRSIVTPSAMTDGWGDVFPVGT